MQIRIAKTRARAPWICALAAFGFLVFVSSPASAVQNAQQPSTDGVWDFASPGDSLPTPGPLAKNLSPDFSKADVGKAIKLVANWQLGRMPNKAQYFWMFAALYDGFMAVPDAIDGDKYKQAALDVANRLNWQPGPRVEHADDQAIGQMYMEQYFIHKDAKMMDPMRARLDAEIATPEDPTKPLLWWWCDALFMAPPVFADMAKATGDMRYVDFMDREWAKTTDLLYDKNKHLYSRDSTYLYKREKNGEKLFWSRGNGWVMAGIVQVLKELPDNSPLRPKYVALLKEMCAEMRAIQGKDGLWRSGLLDADSYPQPEISGSAFITYALAYGVNQRILDHNTYWPVVEKAWAGMLTHIYADGRLGCIQPVAGAPGQYPETSSYVYGVGAFLLAGSEIYSVSK